MSGSDSNRFSLTHICWIWVCLPQSNNCRSYSHDTINIHDIIACPFLSRKPHKTFKVHIPGHIYIAFWHIIIKSYITLLYPSCGIISVDLSCVQLLANGKTHIPWCIERTDGFLASVQYLSWRDTFLSKLVACRRRMSSIC